MKTLILSFCASLMLGVVLSKFWLWFVVPLGVPPLRSYCHAFALMSLLRLIPWQAQALDEEEVAVRAINLIGVSAVTLGIGWLCRFGM